MSYLENINSPADLKKLSVKELEILAGEIRQVLIDTISKTGGHLASNLGVVELSLCIHYVFDSPKDKILWDVGHQSYVHKIITGRLMELKTLRQWGGISGFPKSAESCHDIFNTGHSGTTVSAAVGLARARDLNGETGQVIAVVGDASFGGMAFEAINDSGYYDSDMLVILNDNQMSISKTHGSISQYLDGLRATKIYHNTKQKTEYFFKKLPLVGDPIANMLKKLKNTFKSGIFPITLFDCMGFNYYGPADGHDIKALINILQKIKKLKGKVLLHVNTIKGKGYIHAENHPEKYHGIGSFNPVNGENISIGQEDFSVVFGKALTELAYKDRDITATCAAMPIGTGLIPFFENHPKRYFDVGIAEEHAVTMCAGLAKGGKKPVFAVYSSFLQRAYDQILHDICLQKLHVVLAVDRCGIVGEDGETHQGIYNISYLAHMPGLKIFMPSCYSELQKTLEYSLLKQNGPVAIMYPRGASRREISYKTTIEELKGELVKDGKDAVFVTSGRLVDTALEAAEILKENNIDAAVADIRVIKPLDKEFINALAKKFKRIYTVEENVYLGGIGEMVTAAVKESGADAKVFVTALPDEPVPHGSTNIIFEKYGLSKEALAEKLKREKFEI